MSEELNVLIRTQRIVVEPTSRSVSVVSAGPQGPSGPAGSAIPDGGTTGQVLTKDSGSDGDASWQTPESAGEAENGIPSGGLTSQILAKASGTDFDAEWVAKPAGLPPGGSTNQGLRKIDGSDYNVGWVTPTDTNTLGPDGDKGDVTVGGSGTTLTIDNDAISTAKIANDAVTNAKLANVPTATFKGRTSASTGDVEDLTVTEATALLEAFSSSLKGLAPASGGGTTNFLRADGTWAAPSGGGGGGEPSDGDKGDITVSSSGTVWAIDNDVVTLAKMANIATARFLGRLTASTGDPEALTGTQATTLLDAFTSSLKGLAPASGGGTANYLRADGTWATPPGHGTAYHYMCIDIVADATANMTLTNMASAEDYLDSSQKAITKLDLSQFTHCRLGVRRMAGASAAGAKLMVQYAITAPTSTFTGSEWSESGAEVSLNATNTQLDSGWVSMPGGMKIDDCFIDIITSGGDGVADPVVGSIRIFFRGPIAHS